MPLVYAYAGLAQCLPGWPRWQKLEIGNFSLATDDLFSHPRYALSKRTLLPANVNANIPNQDTFM